MPSTQAPRHLPGLSPAALIGGYFLLGILPLIIAWFGDAGDQPILRALSGGLVMVAFSLMLVQFVLSGRFERVSGKVGIDVTMRFHQLAAWIVLGFIVAHPLLYPLARLPDNPAGAWAMLVGMVSSTGLRTGVVAWVLLIVLVVMAIFRDRLGVGYEAWRLSHGVGAVAIAVLALDHTLAVGTHSGSGLLAWYWMAMTAVAVGSVLFVYGVKPVIKARRPYRVVSNRRIADRTWEVVVEPEHADGRIPVHAPGQFAWLNLGHKPYSLTEHPFSIATPPSALPRIGFAIKESGDFTSRIGEIATGTRAFLDGPHGSFTTTGRDRPVDGRAPEGAAQSADSAGLVMIAGGVGLAPMAGILAHLVDTNYPLPVHLIYGNRLESQIMYRDRLEQAAAVLDMRVDLVLSEPPEGWTGKVGNLTPDVLRACLPDALPRDTLYLVCGPAMMMTVVEDALVGMGVPGDRIVAERFKYD
ncbi:ferric reductase-like transmembrane domain-containing protein [Fodinicurvata sp. EGI_FJ10296]|uniref:ferredoxin reductase family protein n=1 Tax=Fodinicurvata sp. EGI_FJ10296 TaxID=3231908 RepID=UPI0034570E5A